MNRRVEEWRDRFPLELVEKHYRGCGQERGKRYARRRSISSALHHEVWNAISMMKVIWRSSLVSLWHLNENSPSQLKSVCFHVDLPYWFRRTASRRQARFFWEHAYGSTNPLSGPIQV